MKQKETKAEQAKRAHIIEQLRVEVSKYENLVSQYQFWVEELQKGVQQKRDELMGMRKRMRTYKRMLARAEKEQSVNK